MRKPAFRRLLAVLVLAGAAVRASAIDAPADLITHSQPADGRVILSWTPVSGAVSYRVHSGTTYGSYSLLADVGTHLHYCDEAFSSSATTYYVVRAFDGSSESANSNAVSFTPDNLCLTPDRIVIVVNDNSADSVEVGNYYSAQRGVPAGNVCHVSTVTTETCSAAEYADLAADVGSFLDANGLRDSTYCLLTTYGIPLRETGSDTAVDNRLATIRAGTASNDYYSASSALLRRCDGQYSVYMVTRLDGASKDIAKGLVDKALAAEADPDFYSSGVGAFDARRHAYSSAYTIGDIYARDAWLAARRIGLSTYLNDDDGPIHPGEVTDPVILYWGWYVHYYGAPTQSETNPDNFEDPFTFATGAVAVHLESSTCATLRRSDYADLTAHCWAPWMINHKGVTASGGAVAEPFLGGYAHGDMFVTALTEGFTFAEAAYASTPGVNWMMC